MWAAYFFWMPEEEQGKDSKFVYQLVQQLQNSSAAKLSI